MFAKRIKTLRNFLDLTQSEMANYLNVSTASVNQWEKNLQNPAADIIDRIYDVFKVSPGRFFNLENIIVVDNSNVNRVNTDDIKDITQ